jgi:predicted nucleic acid-binding protein
VNLTDALIAATAVEHGLPVVTQDENFETIATAHARLELARV